MLKKIYQELVAIRKELQAIRSNLEYIRKHPLNLVTGFVHDKGIKRIDGVINPQMNLSNRDKVEETTPGIGVASAYMRAETAVSARRNAQASETC